MATNRPDGEPLLEIQIHPSDIRRGVRTFFLTRERLRALGVGLGAVLLFVLVNLVFAPGVLRDYLSRREYRSLATERAEQGQRLQQLTGELEELSAQTEQLSLRMERIFLTYGLDADDSVGQGGFPSADPEEIDSIYAGAIRQGRLLEGRLAEELGVLETFIDEVVSFEAAHADQVRTTPSISPLKSADFVLTSPFGIRRSPFTKNLDSHPGIDLAAHMDTPIHSPADGVVVFAGRYPIRQSVSWWRYGNMVAIRHGDRFITLFGHCNEIEVRTGQRVTQGEVIATVGNTGWSTSPHLHYEVRTQGEDGKFKPVDPRVYILDHRWRNEEQLLVRARRAPELTDYEPLPRLIGRSR